MATVTNKSTRLKGRAKSFGLTLLVLALAMVASGCNNPNLGVETANKTHNEVLERTCANNAGVHQAEGKRVVCADGTVHSTRVTDEEWEDIRAEILEEKFSKSHWWPENRSN